MPYNRSYEPQITVEGEFKQTDKSDIIVFEIPLGPLRIVCIVTVPDEGKTRAPVYVKFRVQKKHLTPRVTQRPNGNHSPKDAPKPPAEPPAEQLVDI